MTSALRAPGGPPRRSVRNAQLPPDAVELGPKITAKRRDDAVHQVRAALDKRLRILLSHDPGTRSGDDPEDLHQMRVSVRRMRAALNSAKPLLDRQWADDLRAELGWLGRALGPVRDADVFRQRLHGHAESLPSSGRDAVEPLIAALEAERETAREEMLEVLSSDRYAALLRRLAEATSQPLPASTEKGATPSLLELTQREYRKLAKAVRRAGDDPPDQVLHNLRIRTKRLRYTGELAATAGGSKLARLISATEQLQEVLGDHQDACVAMDRIRELVDGLGDVVDFDVVFTAGRLVEREEAKRLDRRERWQDAWREVRHRASRLS